MSAKIQVEFDVIAGSLSKALEQEIAKISGVVSAANAEQIKSEQLIAKLKSDNAKAEQQAAKAIAETHKAKQEEHKAQIAEENSKFAKQRADFAKAREEERQARAAARAEQQKNTSDSGNEETTFIRSTAMMRETALAQMDAMRDKYAAKQGQTEKQAAKAIVAEIQRVQEQFQANKLVLANETIGKEEKAAIGAEQKRLSAHRSVMNAVALENTRIAKHGEGVAVGILGTGRNIENVYGKLGSGLGKMAGGLGIAGIAGMTLNGTFADMLSNGSKLKDQQEGLATALAGANIPAEAMSAELETITNHAKEFGDKMNIPRDRVREVATGVIGITGLTGEAATQATELALGYEQATGGMLSAEKMAKLLSKSIGDPENEKSLKVLEAKYPGIGAQMAAATSEQEKLNILQKASGPVFDQMAENASGMWDQTQIFVRGLKESAGGLVQTVGDTAVPIATATAGMLPLVGAVKNFAIAEKVASVAKGISTAAQWALNSAMLANPIVWVVAGVVALVAVFVLLYNKVEVVRVFIDKLWATIKSGIGFLGSLLGITEENTEATKQSAVATDESAEARKREAIAMQQQQSQLESFLKARKSETDLLGNELKTAEETLQGINARLAKGGEYRKIGGRLTLVQDTEADIAKLKAVLPKWEEEVNKLRGINDVEEKAKPTTQKKEKAAPAPDKNKPINDALKAEEVAHQIAMRELRRKFISGEIKSESDYKVAQLGQQRSHKQNILEINKKFSGEIVEAEGALADAVLDIDADAKERLLAAEKEASDRRLLQIERAKELQLTVIQANTEKELHEAEVYHILHETPEEDHQRKIFEIKRNALLQQLAMQGILTKEGIETMKALNDLGRAQELADAKAANDKRAKQMDDFKDTAENISAKIIDVMNIGKEAEKAKNAEKKQHKEQMANFKGTLMERNKLEREHQDKIKEIDEQAARDRRVVVIEQIEAAAMKALAGAMGWIFETIPFPFSIAVAAAAGIAVPALFSALKGFKKGGYTGEGDPSDEAGVVHKDEFVLPSGTFQVDRNGRLLGVTKDGVNLQQSAPRFYASPQMQSQGGMSGGEMQEMLAELRAIRKKETGFVMSEKRMLLSDKRGGRSLARETV